MDNPTKTGIVPPPADESAPPPPYTERDRAAQYTDGLVAPSYSEASASTSPANIAGVKPRFPPTLNGYLQKGGMSRTLLLGEHAEKPLHAVIMHSGWTSKPELILHTGPSSTDPVLATAINESRWTNKHVMVELLASEGPKTAVKITQNAGWRHVTWSFSVDVGLGKDTRRENFEWRHSRSGEIRDLDKYSWGWKLVRLGSEDAARGGDRATRSVGATSDGKEVVAVWAIHGKMSMNKAFKFQYLGSAVTGMLGETFATVALMSALKMWYQEYMVGAATSASTAAAGGAGA
ncbi:hypothetical protein F4779DRAFT_611931 [Xylariaceae sp. FL0662B]|nr:hypothetical protein F4779DRAFT_611931 [Xylariaceae sp. FL0662B]